MINLSKNKYKAGKKKPFSGCCHFVSDFSKSGNFVPAFSKSGNFVPDDCKFRCYAIITDQVDQFIVSPFSGRDKELEGMFVFPKLCDSIDGLKCRCFHVVL